MHTKTMLPSQGPGTCAPGAIPGGLSRTRFFDGMFLTQADLETEQTYWRMKRRLTNRALGVGVVWGLRLTFDPATRRFRLSPGYAIDCCGNDLIVECPIEVSEAELLQRSQALLGGSSLQTHATTTTPPYCVILQYVECPDATRPVHRDACSPPGTACEPSRIRETCRLLLVPHCSSPMDCTATIGKLVETVQRVRGDTAPETGAPTWARGVAKTQETTGAVLFTALSTFLRTADRTKAGPTAQLGASMLLANVAAGMLGLDLDAASPQANDAVDAAADDVFDKLCAGLLYPGPRCRDDHHGVYLGCMRNDDKRGRVFDLWECRREVLTGPLINWWLCQFGVPPIDWIVNWFAALVCEIAQQEAAPGTIEKVVTMNSAAEGMVSESREVSPLEMYAAIARAITSRDDGIGLVKLQSVAPNGKPMSMIVPAAAAASTAAGSESDRLVHAMLVAERAVQPLSRGPLRDLVGALARRTRVSAVAANVDAESVKPLGTMTVSDLLDAEPEAVLAKIGGAKPTEAHRTAVNLLYANAEAFLRDLVAASVPAGKAGVTRAQLKGAELKAALRKVTGVTAGVLDDAAAAASKR